VEDLLNTNVGLLFCLQKGIDVFVSSLIIHTLSLLLVLVVSKLGPNLKRYNVLNYSKVYK
jgi:hypothetical protein